MLLEINETIHLTLDLLPKVSEYLARERNEKGITAEELKATPKGERIPEDIVELLDWQRIYLEIYDFKLMRGYWNLVLNEEKLKFFYFR